MHRVRRRASRILEPAQAFIQTEAFSGVILLAFAAVAIVWANVASASYGDLFSTDLHLDLLLVNLDEDLHGWINDGLMTAFFLVVGLEIKRELLRGELAGLDKAMLPCVAAMGGMVAPALVFSAINLGGDSAHGWGVPMATDIAFALGVLALLGRRIPSELRVFLLALAIVDDIGAILVIAVFYSRDLHLGSLAIAFGLLAVLFLLLRLRVRPFAIYALLGLAIWAAVHASGVHATLAGVVLGLMTPLDPLAEGGESPLTRLEDAIHPWDSYAIVPLFALANAGVALDSGILRDASTSPVTIGVAAGLILGKPLGIVMFAYGAVRLKVASLPNTIGWADIFGVGVIGGIGFTVALFINQLAFDSPMAVDDGKIGILCGSIVAGVLGYWILRFVRSTPPLLEDDDVRV